MREGLRLPAVFTTSRSESVEIVGVAIVVIVVFIVAVFLLLRNDTTTAEATHIRRSSIVFYLGFLFQQDEQPVPLSNETIR